MKYFYAMIAALFLASCTATQTPVNTEVENNTETPAVEANSETNENDVVEEIVSDIENAANEAVETEVVETENSNSNTEEEVVPAAELTPATEMKKEEYKADSETKAS